MADPFETYGENWLLCLTRKAVESQMEILQQRERERQEALQAQSKDGEDEEDDMSKIVYQDRPVLSKPWMSSSARESHEDVESLTVKSSRPLVALSSPVELLSAYSLWLIGVQIQISVTKMSDEFNADYKFSDRDADQCASLHRLLPLPHPPRSHDSDACRLCRVAAAQRPKL